MFVTGVNRCHVNLVNNEKKTKKKLINFEHIRRVCPPMQSIIDMKKPLSYCQFLLNGGKLMEQANIF